MEKPVQRIIRHLPEQARAKGRDHLTQTELAIKERNSRPPAWMPCPAAGRRYFPSAFTNSTMTRVTTMFTSGVSEVGVAS